MDVAWALPTDRVCRNISCGGSLIYSRGQSPRYGSRLQIPASHLKKQFLHPCLLRRHSRAGGNPDLWFSEIFNDYRSVGCVHGYGLRQYQLRRVSYIFSRAKPTLRQSLEDTRKSSEKTVPHPCLLFRHSRAGGNPDLWLSEIFSDYRSMDFAHRCGLQKYWSRQGVYVLPAKPFIFSDDVFSQIKRSKIN